MRDCVRHNAQQQQQDTAHNPQLTGKRLEVLQLETVEVPS